MVVEDDGHNGIRFYLNFGHYLLHAFEATAGCQVVMHGEAVAMGMVDFLGCSGKRPHASCRITIYHTEMCEKFGLPGL